MHHFLILIPLLFIAGCFAIPAEDRATAIAMSLHGKGAPFVRYSQIDEKRIMLARDAIVFIDGPSRIDIAKMLQYRKKNQEWPNASGIVTAHEKWKVSVIEDYLFIDRLSGSKSLLSQSYISPDGYLSTEEKFLPILKQLDVVARLANHGTGAPLIILP